MSGPAIYMFVTVGMMLLFAGAAWILFEIGKELRKIRSDRMDQMDRIKELEGLITKARNDYYNSQPTVSDAVFDAWVDELKSIDPENKAVTAIGAPVVQSEWKKVKHKIPMGSLNKVNTPDEFADWAKCANGGSFLVCEKLDGLSIELVYDDGKLIEAVTRGSGEIGEDIYSNVSRMIGVKDVKLNDFSGSIRGEIILTKTNHKKYFPEYSNPRNAASGISKRLDGEGSEHLSVLVYQVAGGEEFETEVKQFKWLKSKGLKTPQFNHIGNISDVTSYWRKYQDELRKDVDYDTDGLVVRVNDLGKQRQLGEKDLRPRGQTAWKFDNQCMESILLDVLWEVGNSGRVTPIAVIKPVFICGAEIKRINLHNLSIFNSLKLWKGCRVLVSRRNDVIPYLEENLDYV